MYGCKGYLQQLISRTGAFAFSQTIHRGGEISSTLARGARLYLWRCL